MHAASFTPDPAPKRRVLRAGRGRLAGGLALVAAFVTALGLFGPAAARATTAPATQLATAASPAGLAAPDIDVSRVQQHLSRLYQIAQANGGNRAAGRSGYSASVDYVASTLRAAGYQVTTPACGTCAGRAPNVIAEWPQGPADDVLMLGAHLDSVSAGPGINDNGSGSAGILEVALQLANQKPQMTKRVRFAWWSDEESGMTGSRYYVSQLSNAERSRIDAYLNFDMIASQNWGNFVYDDDAQLKSVFDTYFAGIGLQTQGDTEGDGRSDHASFKNAGIRVGGLATGAGDIKTSAQARMWGGTAGAPFDSCYHRACDTTSAINPTPLDRNSDAIAYAVWTLATGGSTPTTTSTPTPTTTTPTPTNTSPGGCAAAWDPNTIYTNGDQVSHEGKLYRAQWWTQGDEPGTTGQWGVWKDLGPCDGQTPTTTTTPTNTSTPTTTTTSSPTTTPPGDYPAWQQGTTYAAGDTVSYSGANYRCLQGHTAYPGWTPDVVPALWQRL